MASTAKVPLTFAELAPEESPDLVYFSSVSENTHRFIQKLGRPAVRIPVHPRKEGMIRVSRPYILVTPTYGGGDRRRAVPKQVIAFLNDETTVASSAVSSRRETPISALIFALPEQSFHLNARSPSSTTMSCWAQTATL